MPGWWSDVLKSAEYHRHIQEDGAPGAQAIPDGNGGVYYDPPHPAVGADWDEVYRKEDGARGLFQQHKAGK